MNKRPYLTKLFMPILILLLWAVLILFPLPSSADEPRENDAIATTSTLVMPAPEIDYPASTSPEILLSTTTDTMPASVGARTLSVPDLLAIVVVKYPYMPIRSIEQTGLKAGDQFTVTLQNISFITSKVTADLHELGLPSEASLDKVMPADYFTTTLTLPEDVSDGVKTFVIHAQTDAGIEFTQTGTIVVDNSVPTGTLKATFTKSNDLTGSWVAHVSGTFNGTGSDGRVVNEFTYGVDKDGKKVDGGYTSEADTILQASSPFSFDLPITAPDISWSKIGYGVTIADQAGNLTTVESTPVPIERPDVPLIDHAITGGVVTPSPYTNIPAGVGIPYALISGLPRGDYFATVFFNGVQGCPSNNYQINAFVPGSAWGVGVRPDLYQKAYATTAGGCMQQFNIDPDKGNEWLWGALSNTGSASAIADENGIPAFAICATAAVCDTVLPHERIVASEPTGISNVLFLPGIEGSNLYRHNDTCNDASGLCDTPLWLPPNNSFVPQLFLTQDGKSVKDDVYVKEGDILTQAYGKKFYASLTQDLDSLEANGKFGVTWKWKAVAYDWRLSLSDIISNGVERNGRIYYEEPSSTPYIEQTLRELAATSKTGKVTILTHSNGGLVAKALMQKLGFEETDRLVDKVIFVGTPQSGVPEAVGALLYGDKQGIPNITYIPNVILSTANARTFGLNSPMAYSLLPTDNYFADVLDLVHPVLSFTANTLWGKERAAYGSAITTQDELQSFVLAEEGGRTMPAANNLTVPNILNGTLFQKAILEHIVTDSWIPPEHVKVYQIAGWGADTVSGIDLYERPKTRLGVPTGGYKPEHRLSFVEDGDGSVPVPSALMMLSSEHIKRYWENLKESKKGNHTFTHTDLFEIPQLRTFLQNLIAGSEELPASIYAAQPTTTDATKKLLFTLHSVNDFDLSDSAGNHTGNGDGVVEESIPGSTFGELGDLQYALAPSGHAYTLTIHGTSSEPFSLDLAEMIDDTVVASTSIFDVPATDHTRATLSITNGISDASMLAVDSNGDGTTEFSVSPITGEVQYASSTETQVSETSPTETSNQHSSAPSSEIGSHTSGSNVPSVSFVSPSTVMTSAHGQKVATQTPQTIVRTNVNKRTPSLLAVMERKHPVIPAPSAAVVVATSSEPLPYAQGNQMAAVPESAFLRLLVSIADIVSRLLSYIGTVAKAL